jgi:pimeloyl-ACP methyl ester carboxylesterase
MNTLKCFLLSLAALASLTQVGRAADATMSAPRTYVIVHGAFGGGWDWKTVDRLLSARGHTVYRPSLTGLAERVHLASPTIGLQTHVDDIINVIRYEDLHDVVLVGHSYAGMVLTGIMEQIPERLSHVIFLDASVPNDGENFLAAMTASGDPGASQTPPLVDGYYQPTWVKAAQPPPVDSRQPAKTWADTVTYRNPAAQKLAVTYVSFTDDGVPPAADGKLPGSRYRWFMAARAKARGWRVLTLQSDHVAERSHPKELAELLDRVPVK